jgi:hypothetical protein
MEESDVWCMYFWGGHGCDLRAGHDGPHQCGEDEDTCSQYDESADPWHRVRFTEHSGDQWKWGPWSEYPEGWR